LSNTSNEKSGKYYECIPAQERVYVDKWCLVIFKNYQGTTHIKEFKLLNKEW